jgi:SAM-dependent methyltransferase
MEACQLRRTSNAGGDHDLAIWAGNVTTILAMKTLSMADVTAVLPSRNSAENPMKGHDKSPGPVYRPQVFEVSSIAQAMAVIVTPEPGTTTQERWQKETPFLVEDCGRRLAIGPETCVLDYGCGIGRVAKGLIERFGCRVVGVDFSPSMRLFAPEYVLSERFTVWSAGVFDQMIGKGFRADVAICVWALQHVLEPKAVIQRIAAALGPGGLLYAVNSTRCVPTDRGWVDDGFDVVNGLCAVFKEEARCGLPESVTTPQMAAISVVQILRRPSG